MTNATPKTPATLGALAMRDAVKAVSNADDSVYSATISLALVMANGQLESIDSGKGVDESKNKAYFRAFLKQFAFRGHEVWRGTEHIAALIAATPTRDDKRRKAASDYVDGGKNADSRFAKPKEARLVDGLARLRTWSFRLMEDVCTNHADWLHDLKALQATGEVDAEGLRDHFRAHVVSHYGATWSGFTSYFAKPAAPKVDALDSILKRAKEMTDSDLAELCRRLNALHAERIAGAAEVESEFGEAPEAPEAPAVPELPAKRRKAA